MIFKAELIFAALLAVFHILFVDLDNDKFVTGVEVRPSKQRAQEQPPGPNRPHDAQQELLGLLAEAAEVEWGAVPHQEKIRHRGHQQGHHADHVVNMTCRNTGGHRGASVSRRRFHPIRVRVRPVDGYQCSCRTTKATEGDPNVAPKVGE